MTWLLLLEFWFSSWDCAVARDPSLQQDAESRISQADLKQHVNTLSSDAFEGRQAGSRGGKAALAYLRSELKNFRQGTALPTETTQEFGQEYQNLLLLLPGTDEQLKHEFVIAGAHYDHVGYGNAKNSLGGVGQIHNGADDNASGTSALLEMIKAFSVPENRPARSILFAFWDAEESGLLGSKHWVSHPTVPLQDIRFVLNIDMVGRLRDGKLLTAGWRSAPGLRSLLASQNSDHALKLIFQPRLISDSDHYYFYASGIPVIHFDTDKHNDYHRPSDDPDKINWDGLLAVTRFAARIVSVAANERDFPKFRREAFKESSPSWMTLRSPVTPATRLGLNWDGELAKRNIAQVTHVNADSPAAQAGIRVGDRIMRLGPWDGGSFLDLKTTVQVVSSPVTIRLQRPGRDSMIDTVANLAGTPIRLGAGWIEDAALPNCIAVTHVIADSPADRAGLAAGDIVLELAGMPIITSEDFKQRLLTEASPLHLRVEREGCIRDITVDLMDHHAETARSSLP